MLNAMKTILKFSVILLFAAVPAFAVPGGNDPQVKAQMHRAFAAYKELQRYLLSEEQFTKPENEETISKLLSDMRGGFRTVGAVPNIYRDEPGFESTLTVINDMLDDAINRFNEGKRGYAFWRLRKSSTYCVTCHTRYEVKVDFYPGESELSGLNEFQRAEYYLASRQFEKARSSYLAIAQSGDQRFERDDALRRILMIDTRVHPDPDRTIADFQKLQSNGKFSPAENEEISWWLKSLLRWKNESKGTLAPVAHAERLIQQGISSYDPLGGRMGEVELLRATALLHQALDQGKKLKPESRRQALYLLGVAYTKLPQFFVDDLPGLFLEQCIREFPNTEDARRAFKLYREVTILEYTGSSGTRVPDDVKLHLDELQALAYGVASFKGQA